ncbi:MAG: hypothetical protein QM535_04760 [Limnohabitans sp.]|nr:hypothetical protein [Limnohabitans sp.]
MNKISLLAILIFSLSLYSQNEKPKRAPFNLEIAADETHQYKMDVKESPYFVKENVIQLFCGEKVFVECEVKGDLISEMKVVEKNSNPEKTIIIEFSQKTNNRKEINTTLIVKNPFSKELHYEALMFTPISQQWKSTSIIPIRPNLENFEMWPHSIITLVLENWKLK